MYDGDDDSESVEDWSTEADDLVACPECGAEVYLDLNDDRCPECGHWFLETDRAHMRQQDGGLPVIYRIAAILLLAAFLLPMLLLLLR